jgi:putative oxidoreductase
MSVFHRISFWGDAHHPKVLDIIRILLGLFLVVKGISFLNNSAYLRDVIIENEAINQPQELITAIIYYVTYVHLVGGSLICLGLFTRLSCIFQIPVLLGAVFFVHIMHSWVNSELWLSILVLGLVVLFTVMGSGPISLDAYLPGMTDDDDED